MIDLHRVGCHYPFTSEERRSCFWRRTSFSLERNGFQSCASLCMEPRGGELWTQKLISLPRCLKSRAIKDDLSLSVKQVRVQLDVLHWIPGFCLANFRLFGKTSFCPVPTGSPSRGGRVLVYVFLNKPTELTHSFLFCSCVCFCLAALSTVYHSVNSPDYSQLSHTVLPVLFLL